jgi:hypothetical protein
MCLLDGSKKETRAEVDDMDVLMMFNSEISPRQFYLPPSPGGSPWCLVIDTGRPSPEDACFPGEETELEPDIVYQVKSRAMVVLIAKAGAQ